MTNIITEGRFFCYTKTCPAESPRGIKNLSLRFPNNHPSDVVRFLNNLFDYYSTKFPPHVV